MADILFQENQIFSKIRKYFESGNINFLIGSGASIKAIRSLGNLETDLTMLIREYQGNKKDEIIEKILALLNDFLESVKEPNFKLIEKTEDANVLETLIQYKLFFEIIYSLLILKSTSEQNPKKINIFSTNYDLFMEYALEELRIPYNDGGIGVINRYFSSKNFQRRHYKLSESFSFQYEEPVFNVVKLHGSINWILDDNEIIRIFNNISVPDIKSDSIDENAFLKDSLNLPIILPTKQKFVRTLMEHTYYDLSRLYSNELEREQSVLFCIGFSFDDEHILSLTKRALSNPFLTLFVFPFSISDELKILSHFRTHLNVKVIRVNKSVNGDDASEYTIQFASAEMSQEERCNIDFKMAIMIFNVILEKVSKDKVFK
jgi:hypothetical protein